MAKAEVSPYWLYHQIDGVSGLVAYVDNYLNKYPEGRVSALILTCKKNLFEEIENWQPPGYSLKKLEQKSDIASFVLKRKISKKDSREISGMVAVFKHPASNIFIALTHEKLDFVRLGFARFFQSYYPFISIMHLSSPQLYEILQKVQEQTGAQIIADKVVARKRRGKSSVIYTNEPYEDAFQEAHDAEQWIDKIDFIIRKPKEFKPVSGFIDRDGLLKCNSNFKIFFDFVLQNTIGVTSGLVKLYSDRERQPKKRIVKPLVIEYEDHVFQDRSENHKLISAFDYLRYASYCVFHSNPYVNLSIIDYLDGSSFELWVVSENRIIIVPQSRASASSIDRIVNHIFEKFKEGNIKPLAVT